MSTMILSIQSLANVRDALAASYFWKEDGDYTPLCLFGAFMPNENRFTVKQEQVKKMADEFVRLAYIFNVEEIFKGRFAKKGCEPVALGAELYDLKNQQGKRLSSVQLLKTLQFIEYNTHAKGWLTDAEFNGWSRRDEYIDFHNKINAIIYALMDSIISKTKEYKDAKWN